jgi:hypothetical protein
VGLGDLAGNGKALANCPFLARLSALDLDDPPDEDLRALARSPYLVGLTTVRLLIRGAGLGVLRVLADEKGLPGLRVLHLHCIQESLAHSQWPPWRSGLTSLWLEGPGCGAVVPSQFPASLETLTITSSGIGDEGLRALAGSTQLCHLAELRLLNNPISDAGVQALVASPLLNGLRVLTVRADAYGAGHFLSDASLVALSRSAGVERLERLDLHGACLGDSAALALANSRFLRNLTHLELGWNPVDPMQLLLDASYPGNPPPRSTWITDQGAVALAAAPHLAGLRRLSLSNHRISDAGARALASSPHLAGLTWLDLQQNVIGPEGVQALIESPYLTRVAYLGLSDNPGGPRFDWWSDQGMPLGMGSMDDEAAAKLASRFDRRVRIF